MKAFMSVLSIVGIFMLFAFLIAFLTKILWNGTMPELFGFKEIGYWMAFKIQILFGLLFSTPYRGKKN